MRTIMMMLVLATGYFAVAGTVGATPPPDCDPNCALVR